LLPYLFLIHAIGFPKDVTREDKGKNDGERSQEVVIAVSSWSFSVLFGLCYCFSCPISNCPPTAPPGSRLTPLPSLPSSSGTATATPIRFSCWPACRLSCWPSCWDASSVQQSSEIYWSPAVELAPGEPQGWRYPLVPPVNFNQQVAFLGYEYIPVDSPNTIELLTYWQVLQAADPPLAIFVHLLDAHSVVAGSYDGLSVPPTSWEPGDVFIQWHSLSVEPTALGGEYQVELGFYSPATMQRLPIFQDGQAVADRLLLSPLQVKLAQ